MSTTVTKPPLGLRPRHIVELQRMREIAQAIERYVDAGFYPPGAWLDELKDLNRISEDFVQVKDEA